MKAAALALLPVLTLLAYAPASFADTLKGSTVQGFLSIDGSSTNDFSPTTAVVGPGIEFNAAEYTLPFGDTCEYTANLSASEIAIRDVCSAAITAVASASTAALKNPKPPFTMTFTDTALTGDSLTPIANGLDLSYSLSGDVATFIFDSTDPSGNASTFSVTSAVTPEPASWQLLFLGLAAFAFAARSAKLRPLA